MKPAGWLPVVWETVKTDIGSWLIQASKKLQSIVETPSLTVQVLLANELGVEKTWLVSHPEHLIPDENIPELEKKLQSLISGYSITVCFGSLGLFWIVFSG